METMNTDWRKVLNFALISGVIVLYICLVGLVESFTDRDVIFETLSLGHTLLFITILLFGYFTARQVAGGQPLQALLAGLVVGLASSGTLVILVLIAEPINLRAVLLNASPGLIKLLTFGRESQINGSLILLGTGASLGLSGALVEILPTRIRRAFLWALALVILLGTLGELVDGILSGPETTEPLADFLFTRDSLSVNSAVVAFIAIAAIVYWPVVQRPLAWGALAALLLDPIAARLKLEALQTPVATAVLFFIVVAVNVFWNRRESAITSQLPAGLQKSVNYLYLIPLGLTLLFLPAILRLYLTEVTNTVAIFILMGLGLNIVVGFAGLLDLGYVAFFAIGAYSMGVLTSSGELGVLNLSFWTALPIAVGVSVLAGILLGVPVLRMRGDYLAIVTLGFGEIIRILALSDFLRPFIGGAQGILDIPKPQAGPIELVSPQQLYYVIVVSCLFAAFIAWRLRESRSGRSWMAMREDEDVAEAMGINLVKTKLLAFAVGAGFSGLSGAIFAVKIGSIFPHSFNLLISINALSLIIVGGIGSLPGVVVGSLALVGLPELLREFAEFRLLIYGALLVAMMIIRPEGLWPEVTRQRELHEHETYEPAPAGQPT
ncbi:MAG: branched-chain amino acid ABC transporter permease [Anaerolineae bacterium]